MNNTLSNGVRLLEHLAATAQAHGLGEVAQALDLPKSHVHRLLRSWCELGYVEQAPDRRYRIGLGPLVLSQALLAHHHLRAAALPVLHEGCQTTGLDWVLAQRHRDQVLIVAALYPDGRRLDPASSIGSRLSLHASASGKCLLTWLDPEERRHLLNDHPLEQLTARTLTSLDALERDAAAARARGWAWNDGESSDGVASLAVPIPGATAPTFFLGLAGPRGVVAARVDDLAKHLMAQRDRLVAITAKNPETTP